MRAFRRAGSRIGKRGAVVIALAFDGYKLYKPFIQIRKNMAKIASPLHTKRIPKSVSKPTLTAEAAATVAETAEAPAARRSAGKGKSDASATKVATKKAKAATAPIAPEATQAEVPVTKPAKSHKPKLVRDSFTIPKDEYQVLESLKGRGLGLGQHVRKSELLRAGIQALAAMNDRAFLKAIGGVPTLKTGRPKAD
jgi:hypothetical protein